MSPQWSGGSRRSTSASVLTAALGIPKSEAVCLVRFLEAVTTEPSSRIAANAVVVA